jgi:hypothetical protein
MNKIKVKGNVSLGEPNPCAKLKVIKDNASGITTSDNWFSSLEKYNDIPIAMSKKISSGGLFTEPTYDHIFAKGIMGLYEKTEQGYSLNNSEFTVNLAIDLLRALNKLRGNI